MPRAGKTPEGKPDPTSAAHMPLGVHSVIQMSPSSPSDIEELGSGQDNSMIDELGQRFFPDGPEDAMLFHIEHGATPEHPERWPWPGVLTPERPNVAVHCPTPEVCFPNGIHAGWVSTSCIHGTT